MDNEGTASYGELHGDQGQPAMAFARFKTHDYYEEYAPAWSGTFKQRAELLWTIIQGDRKGKNEPSWAKCCYTLERRGQKGLLGHPKDAIVPVSRLFTENQISTQASLEDYFIKALPRNDKRDTRLPQVNMRHRVKEQERLEVSEEGQARCLCRSDQTLSDILVLQVQLEETNRKNAELCDRIETLEARFEVNQAYQAQEESMKSMDHELDKARGNLKVSLLHNQEQSHKMLLAEEARQQASMKQIEHSFELRSLIEKLTDRLDQLETQKVFREDGMGQTISKLRTFDQPSSAVGRNNEERLMKPTSYGESLLSQLIKRRPDCK